MYTDQQVAEARGALERCVPALADRCDFAGIQLTAGYSVPYTSDLVTFETQSAHPWKSCRLGRDWMYSSFAGLRDVDVTDR